MKKSLISPINPREDVDEWKLAHLGYFSSSLIHKICAPKGLGQGGLSYIRKKAGEFITDMAETDFDVLTESIAWGNMNEPYAAQRLQLIYPKAKMTEQFFIVDNENKCCSTIDVATIISQNETEIFIRPTEIKCPQTYDKYIELYECESPIAVKNVRPDCYFQLIDQILISKATSGSLFAYHPLFKETQHREIIFDLYDEKRQQTSVFFDMKFLNERKTDALMIYNEIVKKHKK